MTRDYIGSGLRYLITRADLDRAVVFNLLTKVVQAVGGALSLLLIAIYLSAEVQGYYYTFLSLVALQVFVELGLYIVITNLASHEWSKLSLSNAGEITGERSALSRLASLTRFVSWWYSGASLVFVAGAGLAGYLFFSKSGSTQIAWQAPWWTAVVLAGVHTALIPFLSLLEGCNQVVRINRFRFIQVALEITATWFLLIMGAGLWVVSGALLVRVLTTSIFVGVSYRRFFQSILAGKGQEKVHWGQEIWPMQWRLAAQGIVNYFVFSIFSPVMFYYHGPVVAGQMGMTLQIITVVEAMAFAWVQTKVPRFGMLVASRNYSELDRLWRTSSKLSFTLTVVANILVWIGIMILHGSNTDLAQRLLAPLPIALFLIGHAFLQISRYHAVYLRAHAREPFLFLGVASGVLIGGAVFILGSQYGPIGAALAFMIITAIFVVPVSTVTWMRRRAEWQQHTT